MMSPTFNCIESVLNIQFLVTVTILTNPFQWIFGMLSPVDMKAKGLTRLEPISGMKAICHYFNQLQCNTNHYFIVWGRLSCVVSGNTQDGAMNGRGRVWRGHRQGENRTKKFKIGGKRTLNRRAQIKLRGHWSPRGLNPSIPLLESTCSRPWSVSILGATGFVPFLIYFALHPRALHGGETSYNRSMH